MEFLKGAKDFTRNPLGIIALFISLIYGFASLLLNSSAEKLTEAERWPLIIFIVVFPVMVLVTFYLLVTNHHGKLYAPSDFKDDKSFLRTLSAEEQEKKLNKEVQESLGGDNIDNVCDNSTSSTHVTSDTSVKQENDNKMEEFKQFREEFKTIEQSVINMIASEYKVKAERNVGIGSTDANFDAMLDTAGQFTFLEVKALRSPNLGLMMIDRLLYSAVVADKFFESRFKLIIAVVYYFEDHELERVKHFWQRKIEKCPVDVELRFIRKSDVLNT